jgi:hypothetical protein
MDALPVVEHNRTLKMSISIGFGWFQAVVG